MSIIGGSCEDTVGDGTEVGSRVVGLVGLVLVQQIDDLQTTKLRQPLIGVGDPVVVGIGGPGEPVLGLVGAPGGQQRLGIPVSQAGGERVGLAGR